MTRSQYLKFWGETVAWSPLIISADGGCDVLDCHHLILKHLLHSPVASQPVSSQPPTLTVIYSFSIEPNINLIINSNPNVLIQINADWSYCVSLLTRLSDPRYDLLFVINNILMIQIRPSSLSITPSSLSRHSDFTLTIPPSLPPTTRSLAVCNTSISVTASLSAQAEEEYWSSGLHKTILLLWKANIGYSATIQDIWNINWTGAARYIITNILPTLITDKMLSNELNHLYSPTVELSK